MLWRIIFLLCIVFRDVTTTTNEFFMSKRMIINRSITLHCVLKKKFKKKINGLILIWPPPPPKKKKKEMERYFIDIEMGMKAIFRSLNIGLCMFHLITKYGESHEQIPLIYNRYVSHWRGSTQFGFCVDEPMKHHFQCWVGYMTPDGDMICTADKIIYRKIPKISLGLIFFKDPFWGAYFWRVLYSEGLIYEGKFAFHNRLG